MAKQDLHRPKVARGFVDERSLRPSHRMRTILPLVETDRRDPFIDKARILPCAQVAEIGDSAWEHKVVDGSSAPIEPSGETFPRFCHDFELHRSTGLLLDDGRAVAKSTRAHQVAYLDLDEIAASQLAIDGQIEQRSVAQAPMFIEIEADRPNIPQFQGSLWTHVLPGIPRTSLMYSRVKV